MLKSIDIRQHNFSRSLRGYDVEEVKSFLGSVANEWQEAQSQIGELKRELESAQSSLESYKEMEGMLHRTLQQAENSSSAVLENAKQEADRIVKEAEREANRIIQEAYDERSKLDNDINNLYHRRSDVLSQMKLFMRAQIERLENFESHEMTSLVPPERHHRAPAAYPMPEEPAPSAPASEPERPAPSQPEPAPRAETTPGSAPERRVAQAEGAAGDNPLLQSQRSFFEDVFSSGRSTEGIDDITDEL